MKTEIIVLLPIPHPIPTGVNRSQWLTDEQHKLICYGNRWLDFYGIDGCATLATHKGIELVADAEQFERWIKDTCNEMDEDCWADYKVFWNEANMTRPGIGSKDLFLEFLDVIGWFDGDVK